MQKIYCSQCGSPNLYAQAKPKFCSACGKPFYGVVVEKEEDKKAKVNKVRAQEEYDEEDDDEGEDDQESTPIPELRGGLDVDIEFDSPRKESLSKIAASLPDNLSRSIDRKPQGFSEKEILKMIKQEAGTLRQK
jgi:uncharacterized Zn finger protein (UPF0148 family)